MTTIEARGEIWSGSISSWEAREAERYLESIPGVSVERFDDWGGSSGTTITILAHDNADPLEVAGAAMYCQQNFREIHFKLKRK